MYPGPVFQALFCTYKQVSLPFSHSFHKTITMSSPPTSSHEDVNPKEVGIVTDEEKVPRSPTSSHEITVNTADEVRLLWKIDLHLLPILFVLYMFAFLDRVNIGNAKIQGLMTDLKMSGTDYNVASMILFVPYILLEVPSNIILKKVRPSMWLSGLMFFWGVTTMCQGFVTSYGGLLVCRVFLGVFEAGVFPG
jgi:sugar phosphate permease